MKILVCVKAVPTSITNIRLSVTENRLVADCSSITIDEADEYTVEQALKVKSAIACEITAITAGPLTVMPALHAAIARGADKAIRVDADGFEPEDTALKLAGAIKNLDYDLILAGIESSDSMAGYVPVALAERLGIPFASGITQVTADPSARVISVHKELGGGIKEILQISLPALLCIQPGIFELPYVPARKLLTARSRPISTLTANDVNSTEQGDPPHILHRKKIIALIQPAKRQVKMIDGKPAEIAQEMLRKIREAIQ